MDANGEAEGDWGFICVNPRLSAVGLLIRVYS